MLEDAYTANGDQGFSENWRFFFHFHQLGAILFTLLGFTGGFCIELARFGTRPAEGVPHLHKPVEPSL